MSSLALLVDRSTDTDVRAPVRTPGFCAGAVGGLPPPLPAGFAAPPPAGKGSPEKDTAAGADSAAAAAAAAVSPEGAVVPFLAAAAAVVVVFVAPATALAGAGERILWSRNPLATPLTLGWGNGDRGVKALHVRRRFKIFSSDWLLVVERFFFGGRRKPGQHDFREAIVRVRPRACALRSHARVPRKGDCWKQNFRTSIRIA